MMLNLIAETATAPDPMISGNWIIGLIGALTSLATLLIGKRQGIKEAADAHVTLKKPVPTIQTREEPAWATKPDLEDHIDRTDAHFAEVWKRFESDRAVARESANNMHKRLDKQSEATAGVAAALQEVKETTRTLLDLALHPTRKPPTGR